MAPKSVLDEDLRDAIIKRERWGEETRWRFETDERHSWRVPAWMIGLGLPCAPHAAFCPATGRWLR
jgi:hypothetical protein